MDPEVCFVLRHIQTDSSILFISFSLFFFWRGGGEGLFLCFCSYIFAGFFFLDQQVPFSGEIWPVMQILISSYTAEADALDRKFPEEWRGGVRGHRTVLATVRVTQRAGHFPRVWSQHFHIGFCNWASGSLPALIKSPSSLSPHQSSPSSPNLLASVSPLTPSLLSVPVFLSLLPTRSSLSLSPCWPPLSSPSLFLPPTCLPLSLSANLLSAPLPPSLLASLSPLTSPSLSPYLLASLSLSPLTSPSLCLPPYSPLSLSANLLSIHLSPYLLASLSLR